MTNRDVTLRFQERFSAGDIDGLGSLPAQGRRFEGPTRRCGSAREYLTRVREDLPTRRGVSILSVTEGDQSVAVFCHYRKPDAVMSVGRIFGFESGRITRMLVVFDGCGLA